MDILFITAPFAYKLDQMKAYSFMLSRRCCPQSSNCMLSRAYMRYSLIFGFSTRFFTYKHVWLCRLIFSKQSACSVPKTLLRLMVNPMRPLAILGAHSQLNRYQRVNIRFEKWGAPLTQVTRSLNGRKTRLKWPKFPNIPDNQST